jgi:outer membrane beta-barrel protein
MDRRPHLLLLSVAVASGALTAPGAYAQSQAEAVGGSAQAPQVVEPEVERRVVKPVAVPTENFEIGAWIGTASIEDFGAHMAFGSRIAYHVTEDIFAEVVVGATQAGKTSFELPTGAEQLLSDSQRDLTYYDISVGWNVLPGEVFFGANRAMPSALYVTMGAGNTRFAGDDRFTATVGAGVRLLVNHWLAVHVDARDRMFKTDLLGRSQVTQNLEFTISLTAFL